MSEVNIRQLSLEILMKVVEEKEYSSVVIPQVLNVYQYLEKQERAFLTRLCEGTIERMLELDYVINEFSKVKVKKMKPVIRNILRMGVYQLMYMKQVPASAACNEAVKLAKKKGFVNGVLRNISRNLDNISYPDKEKQPFLYLSVTYSMPEWIVKLWVAQYGMEQTERMLQAGFADRPTTIRCNLQKNSVKQLREELEQAGVTVESGAYVDSALRISGYDYLQKLKAFQEGKFTVQDESSMLVGLVADIKPDQTVVDVCAAPGGKSLHAADLLKGTGMVSSRDVSERKVEKIEENCRRLGYTNMDMKVWDAREWDKEYIEKADVVIADLPCSGLGVMGKKNDIKYKTSPDSIKELAALQREILKTVVSYVKPGGTLIYSTCTVNEEANEQNMRWIESELGLRLDSMDPYLPASLKSSTTKDGYLQLLPGVHKTDGFFLCRFKVLADR